MTIERWLDHHTEDVLEDLAYEMNDLFDSVDSLSIDDAGDFIPPWKVQI